MEVLKYMGQMDSFFPNAWVAYKIIYNCLCRKKFFTKLIKSYLRSTMSQEGLKGLNILLIKKELVEILDFVNFISIFESKNTRSN
ncbi:hypothetical protein DVH24_026697 [Malus domestica]|uniref:Uncharacterized protein n=1 Tax=Malus domestica TaxID=3750 RepID=A0A498K4D9_MALDO|nr:hypothetical protein DVH24_026697 [Malus domestica]